MNDDVKNFLWTEKYRPKTIEECILPQNLRNTFESFLQAQEILNLLLAGPPGIGKTTVARALLEQLGHDYIIINGSMNGNIDTLRNEIKNFASTVSFTSTRKYVILDESDYLSHTTQPALRNFMEEYSSNCGFILTCNYLNKIIGPLRSRCTLVEFKIPKQEAASMAGQFFKRSIKILTENSIKYNKDVVASIITKYFPDWRRVLNELQKSSINGDVTVASLVASNFDSKQIVDLLKSRNFDRVRTFVAEHADTIPSFYDTLYNDIVDYCEPQSVAELILIIAKYQYQSAFVASQEINIAACLAEIMVNVKFK